MREWLVIEKSWKNSVWARDDDTPPMGYIPRDVVEPLLGRSMEGTIWFTADEGKAMRAHPEWRNTEPVWSPLGFWSVS